MKDGDLKCCDVCGRDTRAKYGTCARCIGGVRSQNCSQINDTKDRPLLGLDIDNPILDDLEYTDFYKTNSPPKYCSTGKESTEKYIKKMNKKEAE